MIKKLQSIISQAIRKPSFISFLKSNKIKSFAMSPFFSNIIETCADIFNTALLLSVGIIAIHIPYFTLENISQVYFFFFFFLFFFYTVYFVYLFIKDRDLLFEHKKYLFIVCSIPKTKNFENFSAWVASCILYFHFLNVKIFIMSSFGQKYLGNILGFLIPFLFILPGHFIVFKLILLIINSYVWAQLVFATIIHNSKPFYNFFNEFLNYSVPFKEVTFFFYGNMTRGLTNVKSHGRKMLNGVGAFFVAGTGFTLAHYAETKAVYVLFEFKQSNGTLLEEMSADILTHRTNRQNIFEHLDNEFQQCSLLARDEKEHGVCKSKHLKFFGDHVEEGMRSCFKFANIDLYKGVRIEEMLESSPLLVIGKNFSHLLFNKGGFNSAEILKIVGIKK